MGTPATEATKRDTLEALAHLRNRLNEEGRAADAQTVRTAYCQFWEPPPRTGADHEALAFWCGCTGACKEPGGVCPAAPLKGAALYDLLGAALDRAATLNDDLLIRALIHARHAAKLAAGGD